MLLVAIGAVLALVLLIQRKSGAVPAYPSPGGPGGAGLESMAEAIARFEGYYKPGSLANRTNNPGNIGTWGNKVTSFPDPGAGWDRLNGYISQKASQHPDWDFYDMMRYYLTGDTMGAAGANQAPDEYADYVAGYMGVDPTQTVSSALWG